MANIVEIAPKYTGIVNSISGTVAGIAGFGVPQVSNAILAAGVSHY